MLGRVARHEAGRLPKGGGILGGGAGPGNPNLNESRLIGEVFARPAPPKDVQGFEIGNPRFESPVGRQGLGRPGGSTRRFFPPFPVPLLEPPISDPLLIASFLRPSTSDHPP